MRFHWKLRNIEINIATINFAISYFSRLSFIFQSEVACCIFTCFELSTCWSCDSKSIHFIWMKICEIKEVILECMSILWNLHDKMSRKCCTNLQSAYLNFFELRTNGERGSTLKLYLLTLSIINFTYKYNRIYI